MNVQGLGDSPPGIDPSDTRDATFAGQNRSRGGGRRLAWTAVLDENLCTLFAPGLARQCQSGSTLRILRLHITAVLLSTIKNKAYMLEMHKQGNTEFKMA